MAEGLSPSARAFKKVDNLLKCPVCLENYKKPKFLPCGHIFCQDCLGGLALKPSGDTYTLNCPVCFEPAQLPSGCIRNFPNAYHVSDLKEVRTLLDKPACDSHLTCHSCKCEVGSHFCQQCQHFLCGECVKRHPQHSSPSNSDPIVSIEATIAKELKTRLCELNCSEHNSERMVFCSSCDKLICRDCTIRRHRNHDCAPVVEVFEKHKGIIETNLQRPNQKLEFINEKIDAFEQ